MPWPALMSMDTAKRIRAFPHSIRFRLMLWSVLILAIVLTLFSSIVYSRQAQDLRDSTLGRLAVKTDQLVSLFLPASGRTSATGILPFVERTQTGTAILQENESLALATVQGQVIQTMGPITTTDVISLVNTGRNLSVQSGLIPVQLSGKYPNEAGSPLDYLFILTPISYRDQVIGWVLLGRPIDAEGQLRQLLATLVLASLGTLLVAAAGGYWLAWRAMRPVQLITHAARQISETDLSRRLALSSQDELGELADTFDDMLGRLQAAFERQRQFTADASHELRTPLTIMGLEASRALLTHRTPQEYEGALRLIQSENEYMTRLVNELLTLARMDAGQAGLTWEQVDLSDIALEAVERLAPFAERRKVELSTGELPDLRVRGDRQYLNQLVTNLVENAIKYSTGAAPRVHVETGQEGDQAWVRVVDNGPGIAAEHLPHLFERFYRVDQARSRRPVEGEDGDVTADVSSGSGLGLSIVQWIAKVHGGTVTVESEPGKGSTFRANLPLLPA